MRCCVSRSFRLKFWQWCASHTGVERRRICLSGVDGVVCNKRKFSWNHEQHSIRKRSFIKSILFNLNTNHVAPYWPIACRPKHCSLVESNYTARDDKIFHATVDFPSWFNLPHLVARKQQLFALTKDVIMVTLKVGRGAREATLSGLKCKLLDRILQVLTRC